MDPTEAIPKKYVPVESHRPNSSSQPIPMPPKHCAHVGVVGLGVDVVDDVVDDAVDVVCVLV